MTGYSLSTGPYEGSCLRDSLGDDRLLFAVPKKGRLYEPCLKLLEGADIQFHRKNRFDIAHSSNLPITLVFLPASDIPKFVGEGIVDLGITGQDVVAEAGADVRPVLELEFGFCDLCVQVPDNSGISQVEQLQGKRIITSFKRLTQQYFDKIENGTNPTTISYVSGSVEAACALGLAEGIVDLVESGETMRAAGLHRIATVLKSQAILIENKRSSHPALVKKIENRIRGVILAHRYVYCNYNICRSRLSDAIQITPGSKAPTVSPLEGGSGVAVSVMVSKKEVANIMDQLESVGATDILVLNVANCRA